MFETKLGQGHWLLDYGHNGALLAHKQPAWTQNSGRNAVFVKLAMDHNFSLPDNLAASQDAIGTYGKDCFLAERDRAVLEAAVDVNARARAELEGSVAQHVSAAEVARTVAVATLSAAT